MTTAEAIAQLRRDLHDLADDREASRRALDSLEAEMKFTTATLTEVVNRAAEEKARLEAEIERLRAGHKRTGAALPPPEDLPDEPDPIIPGYGSSI